MKKFLVTFLLSIVFGCAITTNVFAQTVNIHPFTANEFATFVKVFGEMRGPLRSEILKDKKTDFESADPLAYVMKVKDTRDVKKVLKENNLEWNKFVDLMGNVLLAYFSIQPDKTKAGLIKQLAGYGMNLGGGDIPPETMRTIKEVLSTDQGAAMAALALEYLIKIPEGNIAIVKENQKDLDRAFYTKYWKDNL